MRNPVDVDFNFIFFKSQPFCISPVPSVRTGNRDCSFLCQFCFFLSPSPPPPPRFLSTLFLQQQKNLSSGWRAWSCLLTPALWGERAEPKVQSTLGPPSFPTVGSPDMGIGSCCAPALFPAASGAEQCLELGTGHSTSLAWEDLLIPGPCFQ